MTTALAARHARLGWTLLATFAALGMLLEGLHAIKWDAYLGPANETRRLVWTLAHAHGTLLGLIHVVFAGLVRDAPRWPDARRALASHSLVAASVLMPAGFFLGGIRPYGGDPGVGIVLAPVGGIALLIGLIGAARGARFIEAATPPPDTSRTPPSDPA